MTRRIHTERGPGPAQVTWVTHSERLAATPPGRRVPTAGRLAELVEERRIERIEVIGDRIAVTAVDASGWGTLAREVNDAVLATLDEYDVGGEHWLDEVVAPPEVTLADVQHVIDQAGAPFAQHGGSLRVISADADGVRVQPLGACAGCSIINQTVRQVEPALARRFPHLGPVTVD